MTHTICSAFVDAQKPVFEQVCSELREGCKKSHWMWFIFPQINGLGNSEMARKFAISSREEAQAYLNHPILGPQAEGVHPAGKSRRRTFRASDFWQH